MQGIFPRRDLSRGRVTAMAPASVGCLGLVLLSACARSASAKELFTTNAVCGKNNCINPIFPGVEDLHRMETSSFFSSTLRKAAPALSFCRGAVNYDPALPSGNMGLSDTGVASAVKMQDSAAMTMFFFHMAGLGYESWDYTEPDTSDDECVKATWRMVCYTYFPRAQVGGQEGAPSLYLRPCQSSCQNYVRQCQVECCDESVQCVFTHTRALTATSMVETSGYVPHDGPSSLCTGAAWRSASASSLWIGLAALVAGHATGGGKVALYTMLGLGAAVFLQGCDGVPSHSVGNWRAEPDYLIGFEFIPPGGSAKDARLNSCSLDRLSQTLQCSGRGVCKLWDSEELINPTAFCECDRDWADPECRTRRKSQAVAYTLGLFGGWLGMDQFYLGNPVLGFLKMFSLGGFGFWWVIDIMRVGSYPVLTARYRVAADLPHWAFVLITIFSALFVGFTVSYVTAMRSRGDRRKRMMTMSGEEEEHATEVGSTVFSEGRKVIGGPVNMRPSNGPGYGAADAGAPLVL